MLVSQQILRFCPINADVPAILSHCRPLTRARHSVIISAPDRQGTMSSETSAMGNSPALEPHSDPAVPTAGLAALAPDPAHDVLPRGPAAGTPADRVRRLTLAAAAGIGIGHPDHDRRIPDARRLDAAARGDACGRDRPGRSRSGTCRPNLVTCALWLAALLGAGGVAAGLLAVHRGARLSARVLLVGGLIAVAVLTVLPPTGSTDALDYATYGRLAGPRPQPVRDHPGRTCSHMHNAFARLRAP